MKMKRREGGRGGGHDSDEAKTRSKRTKNQEQHLSDPLASRRIWGQLQIPESRNPPSNSCGLPNLTCTVPIPIPFAQFIQFYQWATCFPFLLFYFWNRLEERNLCDPMFDGGFVVTICHNMSQYDIVRYRYQRHFGAGWSAVQRKDCR